MFEITFKFSDEELTPKIKINSSITLHSNLVTGLIGMNGVGKTSLLTKLSTQKPEIKSLGYNYSGSSLVFQDTNLFPWLSIKNNMNLAAGSSADGSEFSSELAYALNYFGVENLIDRWPKNLSGGEAKLFAIIRAQLSASNSLLLLDEPFVSLDLVNRKKLIDYLKSKMFRTHDFKLMVSHDPKALWDLCDKILLVSTKNQLADDTPLRDIVKTLSVKEVVFDRAEGFDKFSDTIFNAATSVD